MTTAAALAFLVILLPLCTLSIVLMLRGVVRALDRIAARMGRE